MPEAKPPLSGSVAFGDAVTAPPSGIGPAGADSVGLSVGARVSSLTEAGCDCAETPLAFVAVHVTGVTPSPATETVPVTEPVPMPETAEMAPPASGQGRMRPKPGSFTVLVVERQ